MDLGLEGKRAMISAASKGLGRAAASALAKEGADIAICSRSDEIFHAAEEITCSVKSKVYAYQADLSKAEDIDKFVIEAIKDMGGVDILIINAG